LSSEKMFPNAEMGIRCTYLPSVTVQSADVFTQKQMFSEPDVASDKKNPKLYVCAQMFVRDQDEPIFIRWYFRSISTTIPAQPEISNTPGTIWCAPLLVLSGFCLDKFIASTIRLGAEGEAKLPVAVTKDVLADTGHQLATNDHFSSY
jgi:hypothetical protein